MNKVQLTNICHKIAKETGLTFNSVMTYYFLESILKKLANSPYQDKFVFKGGFLLSNIVGIKTRTTVDIDFLVKNYQLSKENIITVLKDCLTSDEFISYDISDIEDIKEDDPYGGFRVKIICKLDNIRQVVPLDIATGDVITPNPIMYEYISTFNNDKIEISAYNIETMIAEKLETLYRRDLLNSRSKDFYDLYILYKLKSSEVDRLNLKKACEATFKYRGTEYNINNIFETLNKIESDTEMKNRWHLYTKKNSYAQGITFEDLINVIKNIVDML